MNKILRLVPLLAAFVALATSCEKFVFGDVHVDYNENPLLAKPVPRSGADHYVDSLKKVKVTDSGLSNPDAGGAFSDWATCLVMF